MSLCYARRGLFLMRMHVFGDPAALFADPQSEVSRIGDGTQLIGLLEDRDALIVADAALLMRIADAVSTTLATCRAAVVLVGTAEDVTPALAAFPSVPAVLVAPISSLALERASRFARETAGRKSAVSTLEGQLARRNVELSELNKIGAALSAERDIGRLLTLILDKSRQITAADAGSLYLVVRGEAPGQPDSLRFALAQNDSVQIAFQESRMPLDQTSIAGYVAVQGKAVNVADAYELPAGTPYSISRSFDSKSGYRTKSMLVVPMRDHQGEIIGVIQLINKKTERSAILKPSSLVDRLVVSFDDLDLDLVMSLASQAAVALVNTRLIEDIKSLFESFVQASVTAIESRDPTTSGHSGRVAELTVGLAQRVDGASAGLFAPVRFSRDQIQEIRYASLLHDFGKVGVREKVLVKAKKLFLGEMLALRQRFGVIKRTVEAEYLRAKVACLEGKGSREELEALDIAHARRQREIAAALEVIIRSNEPSVLEADTASALQELPAMSYLDVDGVTRPYITANELESLSIRRGSLSDQERIEIESHVTHTFRFLSQIPWTGEFARVPEIAFAHHEKLDGTGYPRRLRASEIPLQSRMMTISDIFDALVAWDRPYKKAVPVDKALAILHDEANQGKLDTELLQVFIEARVYELTARQAAGGAAS
jgi:HD-GYP domain-containing protein (c-di-GMP phosphodiesterase class II)